MSIVHQVVRPRYRYVSLLKSQQSQIWSSLCMWVVGQWRSQGQLLYPNLTPPAMCMHPNLLLLPETVLASFPRLPASTFDSLQCGKTNCKLSKTRGRESLGMRLKQNCAWCFEVHSSHFCMMSHYTGQKKMFCVHEI